MKKSIVILISAIFLMLFIDSCGKRCIKCRVYYLKSIYYNINTNDSIRIDLASYNYMIDSLEKYQKLGYIPTNIGVSYGEDIELCNDEIKLLDKKGINYACRYI